MRVAGIPRGIFIFISGLILWLLVAGAPLRAAERVPEHLAHLDSLNVISAYEEVIAQGQALTPADPLDEALILDRVVKAASWSRHVREDAFLELALRAVALKEELLPPGDPSLGESLQTLGILRTRRWELDEGRRAYERAIEIFTAGGDDLADKRAVALVSLGVNLKRGGNRLEARDTYLEALALQERVLEPNHPDIASTLNNLGTVVVELGDYNQTLAYHERALAIREASLGPDHEWVAESLNNLSSVLGYLGRYEESLAAQERAVGIMTAKLGPDHPRTWIVRFNLASVYQDMGDFEGTIPICEDVLARQREHYGNKGYQLSYTLDALAFAHMKLGHFDEALAYGEESVAIAEDLYGEGNLDTAYSISQLGDCLAAMGRLDEAEVQLKRSLQIREQSGEEDNAALCKLLARLARLQLRRERYQAADATAARILAIGDRELVWDHPYVSSGHLLAGLAAEGTGRDDDALISALQAERAGRSHLRKTMRVLSESRALDYAANRTTGLDLACQLLRVGARDEKVRQVWDEVIRSRGVVLDEFTRRDRQGQGEPDAGARALADSARTVRERLANLTLRGAGWEEPGEYTTMLRAAEADLDRLERQQRLRAKAEGGPVLARAGLTDVRRALPEDWALAAYTTYRRGARPGDPEPTEDAYLVFVQPAGGGDPVALDLGLAADIDAAVRRWRWEIRFGAESDDRSRGIVEVSEDAGVRQEEYQAAAQDLRRLIWDPVEAAAGQAAGVFLVPAGQLYLVSFPSLVDAEGRYLAEGNRLLHQLSDERSLTMDPGVGSGQGLLAVGGPDFGNKAPRPEGEMRFENLPQTHLEVDRIGKIWYEEGRPLDLLSGSAATEGAVKARVAGHAVLHFATHGFFRKEEGDTPLSRWNHALTHSGLALAGANLGRRDGQDGLLTAQEVAALDLRGVRWAVLSACETGLGDVDRRGEGMHGLRRVFQLAGARTVIMSLWAVPDEWTRHFMENLYEGRWRRDEPTVRAMHEATRRTLADRRTRGLNDHPYFWAGFVAAGDWR